jgi:hypothetical protein
MEFSTIIIIAGVAIVAYTLYKMISKKESVTEAIKEEIAEIKAIETAVVEEVKIVEAAVVEEAKVVATKAKAGVTKAKAKIKKATTRKPKA